MTRDKDSEAETVKDRAKAALLSKNITKKTLTDLLRERVEDEYKLELNTTQQIEHDLNDAFRKIERDDNTATKLQCNTKTFKRIRETDETNKWSNDGNVWTAKVNINPDMPDDRVRIKP